MSVEVPEGSNNGKPLVVRRDYDFWVVKNDGDSAVLFKAGDKEAALKFARDMAEQHGLRLEIEQDAEETEETPDGSEKSCPCVIVNESEGKWVVHHEGDTAILFSAPDRQMAEKFARDMAEEHGVSYKVEK